MYNFCKEVLYLGHVISDMGIATDPAKVQTFKRVAGTL